MNPTIELTRAYHFAARKHVDQRRKGEAAEPYINHLTEVAELVAQATDGDLDVVIAAILHDTVEDTDTSIDELRTVFGPRIADLTAEVTPDDKSSAQAGASDRQVEHAPYASPGRTGHQAGRQDVQSGDRCWPARRRTGRAPGATTMSTGPVVSSPVAAMRMRGWPSSLTRRPRLWTSARRLQLWIRRARSRSRIWRMPVTSIWCSASKRLYPARA